MDSHYILTSLYLGEFAPDDKGYSYELEHSYLLNNLRFLLSRVLNKNGFNYQYIRKNVRRLASGTDAHGAAQLIHDENYPLHRAYSLEFNGNQALEKAKEIFDILLDETKVAEETRKLLDIESSERDTYLMKLRRRLESNLRHSAGKGIVTPLDPYLSLIKSIGNKGGKLEAHFKTYEQLMLIACACLFRSITYKGRKERAAILSEAYFIATAAYSNLCKAPDELDVLTRAHRILDTQSSNLKKGSKAEGEQRTEKKYSKMTSLASEVVTQILNNSDRNIKDVLTSLDLNSYDYAAESTARQHLKPLGKILEDEIGNHCSDTEQDVILENAIDRLIEKHEEMKLREKERKKAKKIAAGTAPDRALPY